MKITIKMSDEDLKVALYYGCLLLRPGELAIDNRKDTHILEESLGFSGQKLLIIR